MNTRNILKEALRGCDREEVARMVGMSLGSLNNQIAGELPYAPKGNTQNFLDRVYNFIDITYSTTNQMVVLEKLAEEFGYMLIANPAIIAADSPAITRIAAILKEFAAVVDEIGNANSDGRIELHEADKIRAKWEIMKRITEEFVLACETGKFVKNENE